jgi:5'-nucleotidase
MKFWHVGLMSVAALFVMACEQKPKEVTAHPETTDKPLTQMDTPPTGTDPYATDPYATESLGRPQPQDTGVGGKETKLIAGKPASHGKATVGGHKHIVQKGDTYFALARKYYGDASKWKKIYEANRARYPDKDRIPVGAELTIP